MKDLPLTELGSFVDWIRDLNFKEYKEGWCGAGGSNGWHCSTHELMQMYYRYKGISLIDTTKWTTQQALATKLKVTRQAVQNWVKRKQIETLEVPEWNLILVDATYKN